MLLQFHQVTLAYASPRPVLLEVSFSLPDGGFYFLTGASGAGKSSLLRLISGIEQPDTGRVTVLGKDMRDTTRAERTLIRRQIGIVFQDFRLIPHLTALENTSLPLRLANAKEDYIERHTRELLNWVGMADRLDALPAQLSGGEQQRVAIARAVVNRPKILLADEPTGNVDDDTALKLFHLFDELNKLGTAVILATHQRHLVERFRKPELRLKDGKLTMPALKKA